LTHTVAVHILDDSLMTLYATILISVMALVTQTPYTCQLWLAHGAVFIWHY